MWTHEQVSRVLQAASNLWGRGRLEDAWNDAITKLDTALISRGGKGDEDLLEIAKAELLELAEKTWSQTEP